MLLELEALKNKAEKCHLCLLSKTRNKVVFGRGNGQNPKVMVVTEVPGASEDKTGIPFVGAAGKKLDEFFENVGLTQNDYWITNILLCRPPENRDPSDDEK